MVWRLASVPALIVMVLGVMAMGIAPGAPPPAPTTYPNGLVVRLKSVEKLPATDAATCDEQGSCRPGQTSGMALIRVTIALSLPPTAHGAMHLDVVAGSAAGIALLAGADRKPAAIDCGYVGELATLCTDNGAKVPTHIAPGREVALSESFDVPAGALGTLAVTVQPPVSDVTGANPLRATIFAGAQTLMTG